MIGESRVSYRNNADCGRASWESYDTNFITGDYHEEKDSESCKPLVRKHGRRKPVPLRKLADYVVEP